MKLITHVYNFIITFQFHNSISFSFLTLKNLKYSKLLFQKNSIIF
jgi:hypothetical protein